MLIGMAVTFAVIATLAAVAGGWAVAANQFGRTIALALLAVFGLTLLLPGLADRLTQPFVALGTRLLQPSGARSERPPSGLFSSLLVGVATGLLWAPCAGPVLGLVLTGAALQGAGIPTSLQLLAYAAGAATSLALALLAGGRVVAAMKRSLGAGEWIRRALGVAVLAAVAAIAVGLDTGFLTRLSLAGTASLEQGLLNRFQPQRDTADKRDDPAMTPSVVMQSGPATMAANPAMMMKAKPAVGESVALPDEGTLPSLDGAGEWLNGPPLTAAELRGKVVLIDFWTYSCINCLRAIPYVRAWAEKYRDQGLVVVGVHAPEFAFEKSVGNVKKAVADLGITYPVAIDNNYLIWRAFNNQYWPAHYFVDPQGHIRHHHFGEGDYDDSERVLQQLLAEAGRTKVPIGTVAVNATGAEALSDARDVESPETYIGYERAENFVSPGGAIRDMGHVYTAGEPRLNEWGLAGDWTIGGEYAALNAGNGRIVYRFHARDLHLVLSPGGDGKPIRFHVTIDDAPPGDGHGTDVDAAGEGVVTGERLYQLVRQNGPVTDHTFTIEFLEPGVQAYAFTFG